MDLRARIVRAVGNGMSKAEAARRYDVGLSTVKRYVRQRAAQGHLRAKRHPGRARAIPVADEAALRAQAAAHADATLDEHRRRWAAARGAAVSRATMRRACARAALPRKKVAACGRAGRGATGGMARRQRRAGPGGVSLRG